MPGFEHAATGAAQIVPRHSACEELWGGAALFLEPVEAVVDLSNLTERVMVSAGDLAESLDRLYSDQGLRRQMSNQAFQNATRPEYDWKVIAGQWAELFHSLVDDDSKVIS